MTHSVRRALASRDSDATQSVKSVFVKWSSEIPSDPSTSAATCSETLDANGNSEVTAPRRWEIRSAQADFRFSQADARPQLQADLLGQQKSDLPRELDAVGGARVGEDRAHDTLEGARPRGVDAVAEDQVVLNAAHGRYCLRDELGDGELPGIEPLVERAQGIERLPLTGPSPRCSGTRRSKRRRRAAGRSARRKEDRWEEGTGGRRRSRPRD